MKRKFLAVLLASAMIATQMASVVAMAATEEVTKTYFNIDFETWTSWEGDGVYGGATQSGGTAISHNWAGNPWQMSSATVADREGKVMKVDVATSGGGNYLFRSRMDRDILPTDYTGVDVLWNEFSIKYEGGFAGFGTNENDNAYSIVTVNKNGQLALGARWGYNEVETNDGNGGTFEAGTIIPGVQLELGQWYDIKVAADFTDAGASSGVPAYVWVNDDLVVNGEKISVITPETPWVYQKLYFDQAANEGTTAYIDDIKVYETVGLAEDLFPEIPVVPDIDNSENKIKTHFNIDFENWTNWNDNKFNGGKNSDGTAIEHAWAEQPWQMSAASILDREGQVMKVNVLTSSAANYLFRTRMDINKLPSDYTGVKVLWNEFSIKYEGGFAGFGTNENDNAYSIVSVNKNGQLELGTRWAYNENNTHSDGSFAAGTIVSGVQLELGQWYNIAVAADFTDEGASSGVPVYIWVNGELVAEGIKIPTITPGTPWVYQKLYFDQAVNEGTTAYIDDIDVYETEKVGNGVVTDKINVMTEALNSISASIRTRNEQYHPVSAMADGSKDGDNHYKSHKPDAEKDGLKVIASLDAVYEISSVTVTERWMGDHGLTVTVEIGKNGNLTKVVDSQPVTKGSSNGSAVDTQYTFDATEGDTIVYTFNVGAHRESVYDENGGNTAQSDYQIYELEAKGIYVEDVAQTRFVPEIGFWYYDWNNPIISYYINCNNAGDEEITGKFFIAAYEGDELVKLVDTMDVTLKKGANTISCTETGNLYNANWTYKAFLWEDLDTATPIVASADVIK